MRFLFFFKLAFLYVRRSFRSASILGFMVFSAVACLVFLSSLAVGTNDAMIRNSVGLFSGGVSVDGIQRIFDPVSLGIDGVQDVLVRNKCPARLNRGNRSEYVLLFGVDPDREKKYTSLWKKTVEGDYLKAGEREIFLSKPIAEKLGVSVGGRVGVGIGAEVPDATMAICGIYNTGISGLDQGVAFVPYGALPCDAEFYSAALFLEKSADAEKIASSLRSSTGEKFEIKAWPEFMPDLKQLIDLNFVSMSIVMILVFGIVSIGISCAFVIFILKNLREYGVMKAMGVLAVESSFYLFSQATILTVLASLSGAAAGALLATVFSRIGIDLTSLTSQNRYFAVSGFVYPRITPFSLCLPPVLAILFGLLGAVWPSVYIAREKAAEILRRI